LHLDVETFPEKEQVGELPIPHGNVADGFLRHSLLDDQPKVGAVG
jgi:hypothetical protein